MAEFEVPQAAVDAAKQALHTAPPSAIEYFVGESTEPGQPAVSCWDGDELARLLLAAAAPHIAAAALRQAAETLLTATLDRRMALIVGAWLRRHADLLDGHQPTPDTRAGILAAVGLTEEDMQERADG